MKSEAQTCLLAFVIALLLAGPVYAGPMEDAATAYEREDYATAYRLYLQLADQGNLAAEYNLGVLYSRGQGLPQDDAEAARWWRQAADQGYADAQFFLGLMCFSGRGVQQNDAEAAKWFRQAADQGVAGAQFSIGGGHACNVVCQDGV